MSETTKRRMFDNTPVPKPVHLRSQFDPRRYYCGASHDVNGLTRGTDDMRKVTCAHCNARLDGLS